MYSSSIFVNICVYSCFLFSVTFMCLDREMDVGQVPDMHRCQWKHITPMREIDTGTRASIRRE